MALIVPGVEIGGGHCLLRSLLTDRIGSMAGTIECLLMGIRPSARIVMRPTSGNRLLPALNEH